MRKENTGEWLTGTVTRNPEGLLLLAAGVALLMRSGRGNSTNNRKAFTSQTGSRQNYREPEHSEPGVGERVADAARRAGEYVSEATEQVSETARSYAASAADYAGQVGDAAWERSRHMANQAWDATDYVRREQPWAVTLGGLVAGAAVAALFSPTRLERRTLGEVGRRLRSAAEEAGEQIIKAGRQAGETLSEVAEERGLTREGLKEAAKDVAQTFSSALTGEEGSASASSQSKSTEDGRSNRSKQAAPVGAQSGGKQAGNNKPAGASSGTSSGSGGRRN